MIIPTIVKTVLSTVIGTVISGVNPNMVLIMATTGAAETITIPCQNVGTFNATINWGDGSADSVITAWNDADLAHVYAVAGDHKITISGTFPNIYFNNGGDKLKLKEVTNLGDTGLLTLAVAFFGCSNLIGVAGYSNLSSLLSLQQTFSACTSLTTINASGWDVSKVTHMGQTFRDCSSLAGLDVSNFDTSSATRMDLMFSSAANLNDLAIDSWNIENVANFTSFMFGVTLLTSRYDATLIAWDAQNPVDSLSINFGGSKYTGGGVAEAARTSLVTGDLWTIVDSGIA